MFYFIMMAVFWAAIGSFGTAYLHQRTGRDIQMGGLLGAVVGAIGQFVGLGMLWIWLYYGNTSRPVGRMYGASRRVWYRWWE
jgi:hypothetical protein